mmetsp:Transcript_31697/g.37167  ORF Transcript_31697/g.37167 Transcript_31697/m.37167 type:complete len:163 (-) Transcript_31697:489-977(-)
MSSKPATIEKIAQSAHDQVNVTAQFLLLFKVLFCQSLLFMILLCSCCCTGKTHARFYDRLFIIYGILLVFSLVTYLWTCFLTTRYPTKVCSGDFLEPHEVEMESQMIVIWDLEHRFYLMQCGYLLNWFLVIESVFFFCCSCASMTWVLVQRLPFTRVTTTVD